MHLDFLNDLLIVFAIGGIVVYAVRPLRLPAIIGLLVAGTVVGPHGMSLVDDVGRVEALAEIGVVLLLFTIGLEFSLSQLVSMWRVVVGAGAGQMALTIGLVGAAGMALASGWRQAVFMGFLAALSSTAIVLRMVGDRGELGTPHGRVAVGVLLFQDLMVVPLVLFTPLLAEGGGSMATLARTLGIAAAVVAGVVLAARRVIPFVLERVVATRSRELFLTLVVVLCLGTAWLTSLAGLSLALGAFLAGLAISESEYGHQALAESIPFRNAFGSLFFVSIGMLLDVGFVAANAAAVLLVTLLVIVLKALAAGVPALLIGYPPRVAAWSGLALAQIGEFAFVLSHAGLQLKLLSAEQYQLFLACSVLSMMATPGLVRVGDVVAARLAALPTTPRGARLVGDANESTELRDHVVIAGYGLNGKNLARTLRTAGIRYVVLEMNPATVQAARAEGEPVMYGDTTSASILEHAGISRARVLVVAISDAAATRQTIVVAKSLSARLHVLARTRFVREVEELRRLGADDVIPEEFETSIEIFARVLACYSVARNVVLDLVAHVREGGYEMLRNPHAPRLAERPLVDLPGVEVETVELEGRSQAVGKSLVELELRTRTHATVLAVRRGDDVHGAPGPDFRLEVGDGVILVGSREALDRALTLLDDGDDAEAPPG